MGIIEPRQMNEAFAQAFNSRSIENLLALYEPGAVLRVDGSEKNLTDFAAIAAELQQFLLAPGTMTSKNNFCIEHGDLALLRADWELDCRRCDRGVRQLGRACPPAARRSLALRD